MRKSTCGTSKAVDIMHASGGTLQDWQMPGHLKLPLAFCFRVCGGD